MLSMITFNVILHVSYIMNEGSGGISEQENNLCHTAKKHFRQEYFVGTNFVIVLKPVSKLRRNLGGGGGRFSNKSTVLQVLDDFLHFVYCTVYIFCNF